MSASSSPLWARGGDIVEPDPPLWLTQPRQDLHARVADHVVKHPRVLDPAEATTFQGGRLDQVYEFDGVCAGDQEVAGIVSDGDFTLEQPASIDGPDSGNGQNPI